MPTACRGYAAFKTVGLTRRGWPIYRHRRELLRLGESAKGRVQPPGEPVNVRQTRETKGDDPAFLGYTFSSHSPALSARAPYLSWARRPRRVSPTSSTDNRQPTTDLSPSSLQKSKFTIHQSTILPLSRRLWGRFPHRNILLGSPEAPFGSGLVL